MAGTTSNLIQKALRSRRSVFQVVIVATLIAFGVNLITSWLGKQFDGLAWFEWALGSVLALLGFSCLIRFLLREGALERKFEAVLLLNHKEKSDVEVRGYDFSEKLHQTLQAVFIENRALKTAWESEPPIAALLHPKPPEAGDAQAEAQDDRHENGDTPEEAVRYFAVVRQDMSPESLHIPKRSVLIEAIEFCFLEFLSLHLSAYFGQARHDQSRITLVERENIPQILLENRILSLLTTPIEDRQIFIQSGISRNPPKGEIHSIFGSNGAVYERFELILPEGTRVVRPEPGTIRLEHKRFVLQMSARFLGFCHNLPQYFSEHYIAEDIAHVDARQVDVFLGANLKTSAFLHLTGWEYYQWIDSFFDDFENSVSFDAFLKSIDWYSAATQIRTRLIREAKRRKKKARQANAPAEESSGEKTAHSAEFRRRP